MAAHSWLEFWRGWLERAHLSGMYPSLLYNRGFDACSTMCTMYSIGNFSKGARRTPWCPTLVVARHVVDLGVCAFVESGKSQRKSFYRIKSRKGMTCSSIHSSARQSVSRSRTVKCYRTTCGSPSLVAGPSSVIARRGKGIPECRTGCAQVRTWVRTPEAPGWATKNGERVWWRGRPGRCVGDGC